MYGSEKIKEHNRAADEQRYVVLKPSQFDDFEVISMIEKVPTFSRNSNFKEELERVGRPQYTPSYPRRGESSEAMIEF